jgi:hypothetical protein
VSSSADDAPKFDVHDGYSSDSDFSVDIHTQINMKSIMRDHPTRRNEQLDLPCPILHSSVKNVYLHQPTEGPIVGFAGATHQNLPSKYSRLNIFERFNMIAYIPSIGIIVLASQKGRAVVLSLTKFQTTYAMRIDRILPLSYQEDRMERPFSPLLGIAVGPIQGTEHLPEDQKRWRLLMTYYDHTIFSYEIKRGRETASTTTLESIII